ncbi:MAG: hypothetical protein U0183_06775 [Polyangiaceae bacterium]
MARRSPFSVQSALSSLARACGAMGVLCALTACGAHGRSFEGGVFREGSQIAFKVPDPPPTWRKVEVSHASVSFHDDAAGASILVNAQCKKSDEDTPLAALTAHLLIGTTERDQKAQETIPFDGREALHTKLLAKLDGVPLAFDIFVLKKDGCIYDFVYVVSPDYADAGQPPFEAWVRGFRTLPGSGAL